MAAFEIRLLGELRVMRRGRALSLPASKKTRALLGYLVATGRAHLRERLCDLLWEGPGDPRAELRWSLTKLRPLLNDDGEQRLRADRDHVAFEPDGARIDLPGARGLLAPGVAEAPVAALREAVALLSGEFLDGLDLPACPRFHEWCVAEREAAGALRAAALRELVRRLSDNAEEALAYARMLVAADPLSESGHAQVVLLLGVLGRSRDAAAHYRYSRRLLETELAAPLSGELESAWRGIGRVTAAPAPGPAAAPERRVAPAPPLVGRNAERARIEALIADAAQGEAGPLLLLAGEPGIGKTRLLAHAREQVLRLDGAVLGARAFEAEVARPYGLWVDALRGLDPAAIPPALRPDLAVLLPELGAPGASGDRTRLFDAVVRLLRQLAPAPRPALLVLDDLQWADDASCSLLHYVLRAFGGRSNLAALAAARADELDDSPSAGNLLSSLAREAQLERIDVGPLAAAETAELVRAVAPHLDGAAIYAETEGNPFFAIELARARERGVDWPERTLGSLIGARLSRLDARSRDVLTYAAALGRSFTPELLGPACGFDAPALLASLGEIERRGLIRAIGEDRYDFAHDLVRQCAYRGLSQPRRRLLHAQIARSLAVAVEADGSLYAELARHASAAGEHEPAARACAQAGERCLRAYANVEAATLAGIGLRHLAHLAPGHDRLRLHLSLLGVKLLALSGTGARRTPDIRDELAQAVAEAERAGLHAEAAHGHHLLAVWYQDAGEHEAAQESTLRAASVSRAADAATRAEHLANTAGCLIELEREHARARELLREAAALAVPMGLEVAAIELGQGLLARWAGDLDAAASCLERGLAIARRMQNRWREYKCLRYLMVIELERRRWAAVRGHASTLLALGAEMGEADVPFARVLRALAALNEDRNEARPLREALDALRQVSDKSLLAYALNGGAELRLGMGDAAGALEDCREALEQAQAVRRANEALIARAHWVRCAHALGMRQAVAEQARGIAESIIAAGELSERTRRALAAAAREARVAIPTPAPTPSDST